MSDVKVGASNVSDVDIHSVTGVLKLYLRELPEPLFTEASYTNFMDALSQYSPPFFFFHVPYLDAPWSLP